MACVAAQERAGQTKSHGVGMHPWPKVRFRGIFQAAGALREGTASPLTAAKMRTLDSMMKYVCIEMRSLLL